MKFLLLMREECLTRDERGGGETSLLTPSLSLSLSLRIFEFLHLKKLLPYYLLLFTLYFVDNPDLTHLIQHRRLTTGKWKLERRQA